MPWICMCLRVCVLSFCLNNWWVASSAVLQIGSLRIVDQAPSRIFILRSTANDRTLEGTVYTQTSLHIIPVHRWCLLIKPVISRDRSYFHNIIFSQWTSGWRIYDGSWWFMLLCLIVVRFHVSSNLILPSFHSAYWNSEKEPVHLHKLRLPPEQQKDFLPPSPPPDIMRDMTHGDVSWPIELGHAGWIVETSWLTFTRMRGFI